MVQKYLSLEICLEIQGSRGSCAQPSCDVSRAGAKLASGISSPETYSWEFKASRVKIYGDLV